ncbi:MAG TPA: hypothetical protein VNB24_00665 [Acidimicrobiales bacterium]|nr:hypothetical protein [Acidimicrobiales bacterium]
MILAIKQAGFTGEHYRLRPVAHLQLLKDAGDVIAHGRGTHHQSAAWTSARYVDGAVDVARGGDGGEVGEELLAQCAVVECDRGHGAATFVGSESLAQLLSAPSEA